MTLHAVQDGVRDEPRVNVIIRIRHEADQAHTRGLAEFEREDALRWQESRLVSEELDTGKTQTTLALEIGCSQGHLSKLVKIWREYSPENTGRPGTFQDAYRAVSGKVPAGAGPSEDKPERRPEDRPRAPLPDSDPDVVERNQVADLAEILEKTLDKLEALVQSGSQQTREFITTELEMHVVSVTRTLQRSKA